VSKAPIRCAIYTRKSSEEGLEQDFNSLAAQREACEAYILSQAGEGWICLETEYNDGGYTGGNMERPGLMAVLKDIEAGKVDIVVVYKVDRLTRSITDFGRIVEQLDGAGASFVSVTQAFNTTTSMGRLTLNVLLSFAQFEREVTGERIRDKIAASKARGMWMGGNLPLGYDAIDRKLVTNEAEAETVRNIFDCYLNLKSTSAVLERLTHEGIRSKRWQSRRGSWRGGSPIGRGALIALLKNPIYIGKIRHGVKVYDGLHEPILGVETFNKAQAIIAGNSHKRAEISAKCSEANPLKGKLFDSLGNPMIPSFAQKKNKVRYRYYVSQPLLKGGKLPADVLGRIGASEIEATVQNALDENNDTSNILRVRLSHETVEITVRDHDEVISVPSPAQTTLSVPGRAPRGSRVTPDQAWVKAIARAYGWRRQLEKGEVTCVSELAEEMGVGQRYIAQLIPLGWMAPDLIEGILDGSVQPAIPLSHLKTKDLPLDWSAQKRLIAPELTF